MHGLQNTCPPKRFRNFRLNTTQLKYSMVPQVCGVWAKVMEPLCRTCRLNISKNHHCEVFIEGRYMSDVQCACPPKWFHTFSSNSTKMKYCRVLPIDGVSASAGVSILLRMACEHKKKSPFAMYILSVDICAVFNVHVLQSGSTTFAQTPRK